MEEHTIANVCFIANSRVGIYMKTSCHGNAFRIIGLPRWESVSHRWIPPQSPAMQSFDIFFFLNLKKQISWNTKKLMWCHSTNGSLNCNLASDLVIHINWFVLTPKTYLKLPIVRRLKICLTPIVKYLSANCIAPNGITWVLLYQVYGTDK